jgi:2-dehydropantoate 2-reductase
LNGVDVYSRVRRVVSNGVVFPACVYVGTHIEAPGKVVQKGGACKILFGPDPLWPAFAPGKVLEVFHRANIQSEWTLNIQSEIWQKFIFICAYGLVGAARGRTLGEILEVNALRNDVHAVILEAISVAKRSGVSLPEGIAEASLLKARSFPYESRTSFQRDFERPDKNDERDLFCGTMIRIAEELGIEIPKTRELARTLEKRKPTTRAISKAE